MGRLEKIVVLTVLFLVAVILAISLKQGDKAADKASPLASLDAKNAPAGPQTDPGAAPETAAGQAGGAANAPAGAMSTVVQPSAQPGVELNKPGAQPNAGPQAQPTAVKPLSTPAVGSALKTREGLEESLFNDLYMYKWKAGDTYPALAERFYGSQKLALRLKTANEGRTETTLKPGDMIFVPNLEAATPAAQEPTLAQGNTAGASGAKAPATAPATKKNGLGADGFYTVGKGDMLSTISQKVYGTSKKWQKIYDANRDVLKDPNALKVGMKLRIPE